MVKAMVPMSAPSRPTGGAEFTHFDGEGNAVMVDVTDKPVTLRRAEARVNVQRLGESASTGWGGRLDRALATARVAGLQGAKQTAKLIPLCHPLPLTSIEVGFYVDDDVITVRAETETRSQTGVEMEALTACGIAALALVAELRADHSRLVVGELALWEKSGGRSGHYMRDRSRVDRSNR